MPDFPPASVIMDRRYNCSTFVMGSFKASTHIIANCTQRALLATNRSCVNSRNQVVLLAEADEDVRQCSLFLHVKASADRCQQGTRCTFSPVHYAPAAGAVCGAGAVAIGNPARGYPLPTHGEDDRRLSGVASVSSLFAFHLTLLFRLCGQSK